MCLNHWSQKENGGPRLLLKMVLALVQLLVLLVLNKLKGSQVHGFQPGPLLCMPCMQSRSLGPPHCDFRGEAAEIRYYNIGLGYFHPDRESSLKCQFNHFASEGMMFSVPPH